MIFSGMGSRNSLVTARNATSWCARPPAALGSVGPRRTAPRSASTVLSDSASAASAEPRRARGESRRRGPRGSGSQRARTIGPVTRRRSRASRERRASLAGRRPRPGSQRRCKGRRSAPRCARRHPAPSSRPRSPGAPRPRNEPRAPRPPSSPRGVARSSQSRPRTSRRGAGGPRATPPRAPRAAKGLRFRGEPAPPGQSVALVTSSVRACLTARWVPRIASWRRSSLSPSLRAPSATRVPAREEQCVGILGDPPRERVPTISAPSATAPPVEAERAREVAGSASACPAR